MAVQRSVRLRRWSFAIGTSIVAMGAASAAQAQCSPDPTVANGTTVCTGVDGDGLVISTPGTRTTVVAGASVRGSALGAVAWGGADGAIVNQATGTTIAVEGYVDGGSGAGIFVTPGSSYYGRCPDDPYAGASVPYPYCPPGSYQWVYPSSSTTIAVAPGATVTGQQALLLARNTGNFVGVPSATLTNAGSLTGTAGPAIVADVYSSGVLTVSNLAGGIIVGIRGDLGQLTNAGLVSAASGYAITGTSTRTLVTNSGTISAPGGTAISVDGALTLVNSGTITGAVVSRALSGQDSTVETLSGTIDGNLTLGSGNDTIQARFNGGRLTTGITGAIDGGAGVDTLSARIVDDATIGAVTLPTGFERLGLVTTTGKTVTLDSTFGALGGLLQISGGGTVINDGSLSGTASIVSDTFDRDGSIAFVNARSIAATGGNSADYAVTLNSARSFTNNGTVTSAVNGVSQFSGTFDNNGSITAAGTAVSFSGTTFTNNATITSSAGVGARLDNLYGANSLNSGTITGAAAGVALTGRLGNTGTIAGTDAAVMLGSSGAIENRAGGMISGNIVTMSQPFFGTRDALVLNAGTINGNVRLDGVEAYGTNNRYFALSGGVLNGDLTLGSGTYLVTEFVNDGPGPFAGINGTVSATDATLVYRVRTTAAASMVASGFSSVRYDLYDNAALTVTDATAPVVFAGTGTVDVSGNISATTRAAIGVSQLVRTPYDTATLPDTNLTIVNRGALTLDRTSSNASYSAVSLGSGTTFTNAGTITVRDRSSSLFSQPYAIDGGSVINDGAIALDGATGINAPIVTNNGTISQVADGTASRGVYNWFGRVTLTNSGTIRVGGPAVSAGYGLDVDNNGVIASTDGIAIAIDDYGSAGIINAAGATISGKDTAIRVSGGSLLNAGTITGNVDLGFSSFGRSFSSATYIARGGTIAGDLRFGDGDDTLIVYDDVTGVSGTIDGGLGNDTYVHARTASGTVTLGGTLPTNFDREGLRVLGADTQVTVAATAPVTTGLNISGTGSIVNTATIGGRVTTDNDAQGSGMGAPLLASFTNQGQLNDGFSGSVARFVNTATGTVTTQDPRADAVSIFQAQAVDVANAGTIDVGGGNLGVSLVSSSAVTATNDGTITGKLYASVQNRTDVVAAQPLVASLVNRGTITSGGTALEMTTIDNAGGIASVTLDNRGTIQATGSGGVAAYLETYGDGMNGMPVGGTRQVIVTNSGTIRANAGGNEETYTYQIFNPSTGRVEEQTQTYYNVASALNLAADAGSSITITNTATGAIEATGTLSTAIVARGRLDLTNAGAISGTNGFTAYGGPHPGAIESVDYDDRIINTGTITGSIATGGGNDRIENYGTITGDVFLGDGDDTFLHRASATLTGTVDGGVGTDSLIIDASAGGTVRASQFVNFERFSQIGNGAVDYVGAFQATTLGVSGGTLTVAAGDTLSSTGPVTITGSDAAETVDNAGTITGAVELGSGNDTFVERAGSRVGGGVDGGAGVDTYRVALSGDRSGIGARTGFEQLAVTGNGTLALTLDQSFDSVALAGTGLTLALNGNSIGTVSGSDAAETLSVDGDIARIALGGGNDTLALGTAIASGSYVGGAGSDTLRFTANAPVTLAGNASGFETIALTGNTLNIGGTLGATGDVMTLGDGAQTVTLADGGTINGTLNLGAGNTSFSLAPGGTINGTVAGGAGDDTVTVALAGARTLNAATLTGFETLASTGTGTLTLTGAQSYGQVVAGTDLTVAANGSLTATTVRFAGGNERLTIAGGFAGAVDGGAGTDTIAVSGGSASAPVAFTNVTNVEAFGMTGGYATVAGNATLGNVALTGGRLVGLANSTLSASRFDIGTGATFGSAGTVNGNVNVAGTLSPGASPGTMTVNGNVTLASGSLSVFELTPTVSDKLVVNGALQIATGATLQIVPVGTLRAGTSYDLITASGGITGGFTTVSKPASLFGVIVQRADRIQLLGQFLTDARFSPQVARSIAYANATLAVQPATSTLFNSLPALVDASGASNARGFAQLTPEAYASATQLGIDHALSLTQVARGNGFATDRQKAGAFTFAQTIGQWHTLQGDAAQGSNAARAQSYGFLGGVGYGDRGWMVGAFAGYLNGRQQIGALGARTKADGVVAGVHGRYGADSGWGFSASVLYDGGKAYTVRALPGGRDGIGRYDLHSWVSDIAASYGIDAGDGWSLRPRVGVTYIRTTRDAVREDGASPFALTVAKDRHVAGFADAGLTLARSEASDAPFRPFVTLGARYQLEGQRATALAGYAGNGLGLVAVGAGRTELVGTAAGGVAYRLPSGLDLYASGSAQTGRDDHQETITAGVRLRF